MAVSKMTKIMIVSHRSEVTELLETLQKEGICQILNAEQAMVTKHWPELITEAERPKDIEARLNKLGKSIAFLKNYSKAAGGLTTMLAPRVVVDEESYKKVISETGIFEIVEQCESTESRIEKLKLEIENLRGILGQLGPWEKLETPVEELEQLKKATCLAGLLPSQNFDKVAEEAGKLGSAVQKIGMTNNSFACLVVCLNETINDIQKLLRSAEFEYVSFSPMKGTVKQLIQQYNEKLKEAQRELSELDAKAFALSEHLLKLEILYDHYDNILKREHTKEAAPATECTVVLEGWVKEKDYARLEKSVSRFKASSLAKITPAEGEEIPVDIENKTGVRPFEFITRLYGMPRYVEVDPTSWLAPFFAVFFGICLGDAGYGLVMMAALAYIIIKMQGDKKLLWMLFICGLPTIIFGALTGGWFADFIPQFVPSLDPIRRKLMWFDPLATPQKLVIISIGLGYVHLMTGLVIALIYNLKQKNFLAATIDQLTWLIMLNSVALLIAGKAGLVPATVSKVCGYTALIPAVMIFLFSHREGGLGARLGMGFYNIFSSIFYMGDLLSYLRLMGLSLVGGGLGMAFNLLAKIATGIPYGIGIIVMIVILIGGHGLNLVLSILGAFVHTLRLQYVEFFPKFFVGGGKEFTPLSKEYKYIYIKK